jgi:hypothetical protein
MIMSTKNFRLNIPIPSDNNSDGMINLGLGILPVERCES